LPKAFFLLKYVFGIVNMGLLPEDFYYEGPYVVFTEAYHLKRGYCCGNGCRHCPYKQKIKSMKPKAIFNWSGGKDSSFALYKVLKDARFEVGILLTTVNEKYGRVSMHGLREELLDLQAKQLGLPLHKLMLPEQPSMDDYELLMKNTLSQFVDNGYSHSIFGDIFLEDLKLYREQKLAQLGLVGEFPIWKTDTKQLLRDFLAAGFKTIVVCIDAQKLDKSFAGRIIDEQFIEDLPDNVDPCGENGEFHTFCFDGPIFKEPIRFAIGETVFREYKKPNSTENNVCQTSDDPKMGFWFTDLIGC
jgi:uncharacterized protein (TIGR00290 family)